MQNKNDLRKSNITEMIFSVIFGICLMLFYMSIFYINFSRNPIYYDSDMYSDINLAKEIWKQKTLFPDGWVFGNQVSVVSTPVLTALFYGIVGNGFTAMAIASSIMAVLVFVSFDFMLRPIAKAYERLCAFTAMMGAVFISGHMTKAVGGMQLIFTMASYYSCYLITAFLAFGCYIRARENKTEKAFSVILILTCALSFGTGMQSLRQTEFMTVPLIVCEGLFILSDIIKNKNLKSLKSKQFLVCISVSLSNIAGLITVRFFDYEETTIVGSLSLIGFSRIKGKILNPVVHMIELFFGINRSISEFTLAKILLCSFFALVCLTAIILIIIDVISKKKIDSVQMIMFLLIISFAETYVIDIFTNMIIRGVYYFMVYPLFGFLVMYVLKHLKSKKFIVVLVFSAISLTAFGINGVPAIKETYLKTDWQVFYDMSDYILSNGYVTLYSEWDCGSKVAAASDEKIECGFWIDNGDSEICPVEYLCNPSVFDAENNSRAVYLVQENRIEKLTKTAEVNGVDLQLLESFNGESEDYYVYKASKPLCLLIMEK